jgi:hypothetical protein
MKLSDHNVLSDISQISSQIKKRDIKSIRNLNRFLNNGSLYTDIYDNYGPISAYWFANTSQDTGLLPNINIIRSCIQTHVSKLSQLKPRPHFAAERGDFETRQLCRVARQHFDYYLDQQDIYNKGAEIIGYADLFEVGGFWICDDTETIEILKPWEIYFDTMEFTYGELSRCYVSFRNYPLNKVQQHFTKITKGSAFLQSDYAKRFGRCEFTVYYDLQGGWKYYLINNEIQTMKEIKYTVPPWSMFWYEKPTKGGFSTCMADNLYPIQREIDDISIRIHESMELNPANMIFVAVSNDLNGPGKLLRAESLTDQVGSVYEFNPSETGGSPVTVATPPFIDPQYVTMLDYWIQYAYKQEGISQLSAQSEKPIGANSGVSLETLQNVESERFQTHQDRYRQFFLDTVRTCIQVYPENSLILPFLTKESGLTWGALKKKIDQFSIQFTDVSNLSKDPAVKLQQIEKMLAMGFISGETAAAMMEVEDEDNVFEIASVSYEYCQKIISDAIHEGKTDFYEAVSLDTLFNETAKEFMKLRIDDAPKNELTNLGKLLNVIQTKMNKVKESMKSSQLDDAIEGQIGGAALQGKQQELNTKLQAQQQELQVPLTERQQQIQAEQAVNGQEIAAILQKHQQLIKPPVVQGPTGPMPITAQPQGQ